MISAPTAPTRSARVNPAATWMRLGVVAHVLKLGLAGASSVSVMVAMVWLLAGPANAQPVCPPVPSPPTTEQVQAALPSARDRGALWTIDKAGRRSWLYGSIHIGNLDMAVPGPKVRQAIAAAEVIALEVDPGNSATMEAIRAPASGTPAADRKSGG